MKKLILSIIIIVILDLMYLIHDTYYNVKALTWKPEKEIMGHSTLMFMPEIQNKNIDLKIVLKGMYRFY